MVCQRDPLIQKISELYEKISKLQSLKPSKDVDALFTQLVHTCIPPNPVDVSKLCKRIQDMRSHLIKLCAQAEGLLEAHYSTLLASFPDNPLHHLTIFPYFSNYLKLSLLEFNILSDHHHLAADPLPTRVAFVGSGPLPLTSIVLASHHLRSTIFDNYDIDPLANAMASKLVESDDDLSGRMFFHTRDIMDVRSDELKEYEVVFLAALVGMDKEEKGRVIDHLAENMAPGALLMLRSAHGARAFLYPVVDPSDLHGFQVLQVFHPSDEVINSVLIARKNFPIIIDDRHDHQSCDLGLMGPHVIFPSKSCACGEIEAAFNPLKQMNMIEEFAAEDHL